MPPRAARPIANSRKHLTALIYGMPGAGKTPLIGTCSGRILIAECDPDGTSSLVGSGRSDIDVVEIYKPADLTEVVEFIRHDGYKEYSWFWIDSASGLDGRILSHYVEMAINNNPRQAGADKPQYLATQTYIDSQIKWAMEAPIHFGITAHVMIQNRKELDEDGEYEFHPMYMPQIQGGDGKQSQKLSGYFSIVGCLEPQVVDGKTKQAMLVRQDTTHLARDRYQVLAPASGRIIEPNMADIERKVMAKLKGAKATGAKKVAKKATKTTTKKVGSR